MKKVLIMVLLTTVLLIAACGKQVEQPIETSTAPITEITSSVCGDGTCDNDEMCVIAKLEASCPADCGPCPSSIYVEPLECGDSNCEKTGNNEFTVKIPSYIKSNVANLGETIANTMDTDFKCYENDNKVVQHARLKNFKGVRSFNSDHQMLLAEKIEDLIKQNLPIKLIIIDSLMSHFRSDFSGRSQLADRQQKLNKHLHVLLKLAHNYNIAVYITNQVMSKPDTFFGDPTEAIGGHVLHHASTYRIYLRRGKKGTRVAKLVDAPALPEGEAIFEVTNEGIKDV